MINPVPITRCLLTALISLVAFAALADNSRDSNAAVPNNATPRSYGAGWICDPGYRKADNAFEAISILENAYPTNKSYESGWACLRGCRLEGAKCALIVVPDNAYLLNSSTRPGWRCERGYRQSENGCIEIKLPENAYLSESSYGGGNANEVIEKKVMHAPR